MRVGTTARESMSVATGESLMMSKSRCNVLPLADGASESKNLELPALLPAKV